MRYISFRFGKYESGKPDATESLVVTEIGEARAAVVDVHLRQHVKDERAAAAARKRCEM
jgi:hypothetical protein